MRTFISIAHAQLYCFLRTLAGKREFFSEIRIWVVGKEASVHNQR